jgi:iron complex transport system substrate-binding protein
MRIVSLLPAATEIVCALGLADDLVGVTHACVVPDIVGLRVVTRPAAVSGSAGSLAGPDAARLEVDATLVAELRPDLILAPTGWRPAAPGIADDGEPVDVAADAPTVVTLAPASVEGILHAISTVGAMTSAEDEALGLVEILRERLADVEEAVVERRAAGHRPPRVVALEWLDPPFTAGRWVPEQIRRAGGWDVLGRDGGAAAPTTWQAVEDLDPEMLLLVPRDADLAGVRAAWERSPRPTAWRELQAVRRNQVFALDAAAYFSSPGPRVIDGIELLAELFDPVGFVDVGPPGGWMPVE